MRKTLILGASCVAAFLLAQMLAPAAKGQTQLAAPASAAPSPEAAAKSDVALPTVKEILEKSEKATGGEEAWKKMTTRSMKGIYQTQDDSSFFGIEILQKAPDKSVIMYKFSNGIVVRDVCDGKTAWLEDPRGGYHAYTGAALASRLRRSEFSDRGKMLLLAATGKLLGTEKVGTYMAYVIQFSPEKNATSKIYFDTESGYVVRTEDTYPTPDGPYSVAIDMDDYREVDGVKLPFRMRRTEKGAVYNIRLTQVKFNAPVDDSEFVKPESASNQE
jgi:zinc protease